MYSAFDELDFEVVSDVFIIQVCGMKNNFSEIT